MIRYLSSLLIVTCSIPFLFGCGAEEPMVKEGEFNEADQLDPAEEAAAQKKAMKENR
ncbi:hypothetical protein [Gimesia aquarii]|uniref:Uncharacterized protein n=1 Tax=Gimesia aquarii TaxID=2527964 RepID=A0A517VT38_9PLAN|nr:hypothetical protein [Gimesia aquarii]QDT96140.1 hypothetical protein V144x_15930 [Gimesia aquarii]